VREVDLLAPVGLEQDAVDLLELDVLARSRTASSSALRQRFLALRTLRILCAAFQIDAEGHDVRCERRLIAEARRLNAANKMLAPIIDDAHLPGSPMMRQKPPCWHAVVGVQGAIDDGRHEPARACSNAPCANSTPSA
jgi:hypothetical protein